MNFIVFLAGLYELPTKIAELILFQIQPNRISFNFK